MTEELEMDLEPRVDNEVDDIILKRVVKEGTQEGRILRLLKDRGENGVGIWEFMTPRNMGGLGIAQYTARIHGLRQKGYDIVNREKGIFVLEK